MSAPEHGAGGSNPDLGQPAVEFETTGLWPIDDPEQTSHIQRPPATPTTSTAPAEPPTPAPATTPPPAAVTSPSPHVDPEATSIVQRPTGNYTQPWAATTPPSPTPHAPVPAPGPAGYAANYDPNGRYQQYGGYPQGAAYQAGPGYPPGPGGYPPSPGYPPPQQPAAAEFTATNYDFTTEIKTQAGRRRTVLLIGTGVAIIAIAAVGITGFWKPGFFVTRQLNISKVQEGVQHILTDPTTGYGITGVSGVICNDGRNPSGDKGTKFGCELSVASGAKHHVEVTVVDDKGTYQVGKIS